MYFDGICRYVCVCVRARADGHWLLNYQWIIHFHKSVESYSQLRNWNISDFMKTVW